MKDPVLSPKSGRIFERALIESYIAQNGVDPIAVPETPLSADELISIKTDEPVVPPRAPALTSVPSLLSALQNEWDALALETFSLRQQLKQTRQELSTALYYHDASVRVVARLIKERDEARESLAQLSASIGSSVPDASRNGSASTSASGSGSQAPAKTLKDLENELTSSAEEKIVLPDTVFEAIAHKRQELVATRRQRKIGLDWTSLNDVSKFGLVKKATKQFFPNAHQLVIDPTSKFLLSGGGASKAGVFSTQNPSTDNALFTGNIGIITASGWISDSVFALGSKTNLIELFRVSRLSNSNNLSVVPLSTINLTDIDSSKQYAVTAIKSHPVSSLFVTISSFIHAFNGCSFWAVHDVSDPENPKTISHGTTTKQHEAYYTSMDIHPDGNLLALGTSTGSIKIFSLESGEKVASLELPNPYVSFGADVLALAFAENGYWLGASYRKVGVHPDETKMQQEGSDIENKIFIWDLRKLKVTHMLNVSVGLIHSLKFDLSSQFIAAVGSNSVVVAGYVKPKKAWTTDPSVVSDFPNLTDGALFRYNDNYAGVAWGEKASSLYTINPKGSISTFAPQN